MEPVKIDIATATTQELYNECARLKLIVGRGISATQMRIKLRLYARNQKRHAYELAKWTFYVQQLGLEIADGMSPREIEELAYDHLYKRLVAEGYVSKDPTGKQLLHEDGKPFYVTGRVSAQTVSVACPSTCKPEVHQDHNDSCAVWYAAGCVFDDVALANATTSQWEADHPRENENS